MFLQENNGSLLPDCDCDCYCYCDSLPEPGRVVLSLAGHDKGLLYVVVKTENDFAFLTDGKHHPLLKPKKKRFKHIKATHTVFCQEPATDRAVRRFLGGLFGAGKKAFFSGQNDTTFDLF